MAMFDMRMCYVAASQRWRDDFQLGPQELNGRSHYEIFPEISEAWKDVHRRGLAGETIRADDDRFVRPDGRIQWLRWVVAPWRHDDQSVGGIYIFSEDITDLKDTEQSLRKAKDELQQQVNERTEEWIETQRLAHVGSWMWDPAHDVAWWSPEYFRILGLEPSDTVPPVRDQSMYYEKETFGQLMSAVQRLIQTGQPYALSLDVIRPDGSVRHCMARGERALNRPTWLRGTLIDVTEVRRLEEEKDRLAIYKQRVAKSESLERLAGAVAHHFSNYLTSVMGNLELAIDGLRAFDTQKLLLPGYLAAAMQSAAQGAEMSRMMLAVLGRRPIVRKRIDLSAVCADGIELLRIGAPRDVVIMSRLPESGPLIWADSSLIQEVLTNLLVNAWEATGSERNIIRIRIKTAAADDITDTWRVPVTFTPQNIAYACLEVSDTGAGILPDAMPLLFDPFYSTKFTGRGLGLAATLGIVQMHNGAVTVNTQPGKGSTFRVFLPVEDR